MKLKTVPRSARFAGACLAAALILVRCGFLDSAFKPVQSTPTTLNGRVVDSITRLGIPGVELTLKGLRDTVVISGENGLFQFPQTTTGLKRLVVSARNYSTLDLPVDLEKTPNSVDSILLVRLNHPPHINRVLYPPDSLVNAPLMLRFSWSVSDTDLYAGMTEELKYYFYFGLGNPPPLADSGALDVGNMVRDPIFTWFSSLIAQKPDSLFSHLLGDTTYYWRVVVKDLFRDSSDLGVFSFRTRTATAGCPNDSMVPVEKGDTAFCMDKYEFSNKRLEDYYNNQAVFSVPDSCDYHSTDFNNPVLFISFDSAKSVCSGLGKRLCTISEWQVAVSGYEQLVYPYGKIYDPLKCNTEYPGDPEYLGMQTVWPVDSPRTCLSPYGVYDLSGNVSEWVDNVRSSTDSRPLRKTKDNYGNEVEYFAGGSWRSGRESNVNAVVSAIPYTYDDSTGFPIHKKVDVGFRCCKDLK